MSSTGDHKPSARATLLGAQDALAARSTRKPAAAPNQLLKNPSDIARIVGHDRGHRQSGFLSLLGDRANVLELSLERAGVAAVHPLHRQDPVEQHAPVQASWPRERKNQCNTWTAGLWRPVLDVDETAGDQKSGGFTGHRFRMSGISNGGTRPSRFAGRPLRSRIAAQPKGRWPRREPPSDAAGRHRAPSSFAPG